MATTEHQAQIVPPSAFDPATFRSIDLADGVRAIIAKRPGHDTTEVQALRFDSQIRNDKQAKAWMRREGYRWRKWAFAGSTAARNAPPANPCQPATTNPGEAQSIRDAKTHIDEAFAHVQNAINAIVWLRMPAQGPLTDLFMQLRRIKMSLGRAAQHAIAASAEYPNPADAAGTLLAAGIAANALARAAVAPPKGAGTRRKNPPAQRQLVQVGTLRALEFTDGTRMSWSVREAWPLLADPGAEKGSRGRTRLYAVPPRGRSNADRDAHKTASRTFETWHDFEPRTTFTLDIPLSDEFTTPIGNATKIVYRSDKWQDGEPVDYEHSFKPSAPARVDGKGPKGSPSAIQISGGAFRLTARGLVD